MASIPSLQPPAQQIISGAALARALGVSKVMVTKYKQAGKISEEPTGGFVLEKARRQLAASLARKVGGSPRTSEAPPVVAAPPIVEPDPDFDDDSDEIESVEPKVGKYKKNLDGLSRSELECQALRERILRERRKREADEKKLVNGDEVRQAIETRAQAERDALLNWAPRVSPDIAAELGIEERVVASILDRYMRQFLAERSQC